MHYIKNFLNIPKDIGPTAVTIGNFDGIHLGHQAIIKAVVSSAQAQGLASVVVSFDPYPKAFFLNGKVPRLMTWREKYLALKALGVDYFLVIKFDAAFAAIKAENFVTDILVDRLQAQCLFVGDDFRFGAKRLGDYQLLVKMGAQFHFSVSQAPTYLYQEDRVSSSRLRETLQAGDMALAHDLLGHHYALCGTVVHGDKLGRELGFPTANIDLHRRRVPLSGIYVVQVSGIDDAIYQGVANIGTRPAVNGTRVLLEVFIFDFNRDIYGENITVSFLHKLREEENYDSLDLLTAQIAKDVAAAKEYLASKNIT